MMIVSTRRYSVQRVYAKPTQLSLALSVPRTVCFAVPPHNKYTVPAFCVTELDLPIQFVFCCLPNIPHKHSTVTSLCTKAFCFYFHLRSSLFIFLFLIHTWLKETCFMTHSSSRGLSAPWAHLVRLLAEAS
jgi:hypothetical protein